MHNYYGNYIRKLSKIINSTFVFIFIYTKIMVNDQTYLMKIMLIQYPEENCRQLVSRNSQCVWSIENRSPAEGKGVTSGSRERSGKFWMCDWSSCRTIVTRVNFLL